MNVVIDPATPSEGSGKESQPVRKFSSDETPLTSRTATTMAESLLSQTPASNHHIDSQKSGSSHANVKRAIAIRHRLMKEEQPSVAIEPRDVRVARALEAASKAFIDNASPCRNETFYGAAIDIATGESSTESTDGPPKDPASTVLEESADWSLPELIGVLVNRSRHTIVRQQEEILCLRLTVKELIQEMLGSNSHEPPGRAPPSETCLPDMIEIQGDDSETSQEEDSPVHSRSLSQSAVDIPTETNDNKTSPTDMAAHDGPPYTTAEFKRQFHETGFLSRVSPSSSFDEQGHGAKHRLEDVTKSLDNRLKEAEIRKSASKPSFADTKAPESPQLHQVLNSENHGEPTWFAIDQEHPKTVGALIVESILDALVTKSVMERVNTVVMGQEETKSFPSRTISDKAASKSSPQPKMKQIAPPGKTEADARRSNEEGSNSILEPERQIETRQETVAQSPLTGRSGSDTPTPLSTTEFSDYLTPVGSYEEDEELLVSPTRLYAQDPPETEDGVTVTTDPPGEFGMRRRWLRPIKEVRRIPREPIGTMSPERRARATSPFIDGLTIPDAAITARPESPESSAPASLVADIGTSRNLELPVGGRRMAILFPSTPLTREQGSELTKSLVILDKHGIETILVLGESSDRDLRDRLFDVSGVNDTFPQFFVVEDDGATTYLGDFFTIEGMDESGELPVAFWKAGGASVPKPTFEALSADEVSTGTPDEDAYGADVSGADSIPDNWYVPVPPVMTGRPLSTLSEEDGRRMVVLISSTPLTRTQGTNQDRSLLMLHANGIETQLVDGAESEEQDLRERLFKLSGLRGVYPQFFVAEDDGTTIFFGDFHTIERMNDDGELAVAFRRWGETPPGSDMGSEPVVSTEEKKDDGHTQRLVERKAESQTSAPMVSPARSRRSDMGDDRPLTPHREESPPSNNGSLVPKLREELAMPGDMRPVMFVREMEFGLMDPSPTLNVDMAGRLPVIQEKGGSKKGSSALLENIGSDLSGSLEQYTDGDGDDEPRWI